MPGCGVEEVVLDVAVLATLRVGPLIRNIPGAAPFPLALRVRLLVDLGGQPVLHAEEDELPARMRLLL